MRDSNEYKHIIVTKDELLDTSIDNKNLNKEFNIPSIEFIKDKFNLIDSWGNTSHPDECYQQGLEDMYDAISTQLISNK